MPSRLEAREYCPSVRDTTTGHPKAVHTIGMATLMDQGINLGKRILTGLLAKLASTKARPFGLIPTLEPEPADSRLKSTVG